MLRIRARVRSAGQSAAGGEGDLAVTIQGLPLISSRHMGGSRRSISTKARSLGRSPTAKRPTNIRNHPALKNLKIPRTGRHGQNRNAGHKNTGDRRRRWILHRAKRPTRPMLRAYNKATGQGVGSVFIRPATGSPMTYSLNGKQYIVLAISGPGYSAELLAFKLPDRRESREFACWKRDATHCRRTA